jgi:hypothetical protein
LLNACDRFVLFANDPGDLLLYLISEFRNLIEIVLTELASAMPSGIKQLLKMPRATTLCQLYAPI